MRLLTTVTLFVALSTGAFAEPLPKHLGTVLTDPAFLALLATATEELRAEERLSNDFFYTVKAAKRRVELELASKVTGEITEDVRAEIAVQAQAVAKLRTEKNYNYDRLVIGSYEESKDWDSMTIVLEREGVHQYPPMFSNYKTIQADLKGGIGDYKLEISNVRFVK